MKITYTGSSDYREIDPSIIPGYEEPDEDVESRTYIWTPGSWLDVPEVVAKHLLEFSRNDFVQYEDPKGRDQRTKAELMEEATELEIEGRSSMNKEELRDAIYARRSEVSSDAGASDATETASEAPGEGEEITEPSTPIITQNDQPDRA